MQPGCRKASGLRKTSKSPRGAARAQVGAPGEADVAVAARRSTTAARRAPAPPAARPRRRLEPLSTMTNSSTSGSARTQARLCVQRLAGPVDHHHHRDAAAAAAGRPDVGAGSARERSVRRRRSSSLHLRRPSRGRLGLPALRATSGGCASLARPFAASSSARICWPSEPRRRSATLPSSASRRPTTAITGTLARRVLADLVVDLLVPQVGLHPQARGPQGCGRLSGEVVGVGRDRGDHHLHRRQPQREGPGVVLDQHADEPLQRAADRPVQHHRPVLLSRPRRRTRRRAARAGHSRAGACRTPRCGRWSPSGSSPASARRRRRRPRSNTFIAASLTFRTYCCWDMR